MKNTSVSVIHIEYNGCTGFFDIELDHLPENATEHETFITSASCLQGVEEKLREFRLNHQD